MAETSGNNENWNFRGNIIVGGDKLFTNDPPAKIETMRTREGTENASSSQLKLK